MSSFASKPAVVITSIAHPNKALCEIARGARAAGFSFLLIGDTKSPPDFRLDGCDFYDVARQEASGLRYAKLCPTRHYARKNIGYLLAIRDRASLILETDDDNIPLATWWQARARMLQARALRDSGWVNVYRYFSEAIIWPRGLPLHAIQSEVPGYDSLRAEEVDCPIQQGLADENPDVDAIYRLVLPLPQSFRADRRIALGNGAWCPFNSQNTTWFPDAYPLLYLPAYCSFRMTDIWRSFVAQRIAWANNWHILFHEATVWQERNEHNLMRDFADEVPGYLNNERIGAELSALPIRPGAAAIPDNLRSCYERLVQIELIDGSEMSLLEAWLEDIGREFSGVAM